jgi:diguanylate cyclase (GGDEF)-like protein
VREHDPVTGPASFDRPDDSIDSLRATLAACRQEIERLSRGDALTGLPNRAGLQSRLAECIGRWPRAAVMVLDLDRFKQINDALGHAVGDEVLRLVAGRLRGALRDGDTLARLGADEFGIVLPNAGVEEARAAARAIIQALRDPLEHELQPIDVAASIGVALHPDDGSTPERLLRCADVAMYAAKRKSAAIALYDADYEVARREHLSLLGELRRAVAESQLRAFYQPKVRVADGRVVGAEALVRWRHPERGLLSPAHFMPYAEHTGYVRVLTRWMLAVTLRQCGLWAAAGMPMQVAVNISTRDLMWPDLVPFVAGLLRAHAVPARLVCLEITESLFIEDPEAALGALHELAALGVHLAIDDYGTGFSSLAYMKRMPVQELKIDASFVRGMAAGDKDRSIVRSTVQLAHSLGLKVVAEGVEDAATLDALREARCDLAQGFHIARPMRRAHLERWVRERQPGA